MKKFSVKKIILLTLLTLFAVFSGSAQEYTLTKHPDAMFWTIDSTDLDGNPSRIYVLGTIHLADEEIYPVPDFILDAWNEADRIYGELSDEDWGKVYPETTKLVLNSIIIDKEKQVENFLTEDEIEILKNALKEKYNLFRIYQPWIFTNALSALAYNDTDLDASYSYDLFFIQKAKEENIVINGLDELKDQLELICYGDFETQLAILKETIKEFDSDKGLESIIEMYDIYKEADAEKFADFYENLQTEAIKECPLYKDYYAKMLDERNAKWGAIFSDLLKEGGTTFVFAGTGHFIGDKAAFNYVYK